MDCIPEFAGCGGGNEVGGMEYIKKNGGVSSGLAYPYVSGVTLQNGTCKSVVSCSDAPYCHLEWGSLDSKVKQTANEACLEVLLRTMHYRTCERVVSRRISDQ